MYMLPSATIVLCVIIALFFFRSTFKKVSKTLEPTLPIIAGAWAENAQCYAIESHADNLTSVNDRKMELEKQGLSLNMSLDDLVKQTTSKKETKTNIEDTIV